MIHGTPRAILYALFLVSGATGLVYELVWTRQLVFVFGGTTYAVTTVLVAFMGGLGLGSYIAGRLSPGLRAPGRVYGVLEIIIGLYALLVPILLSLAEPLYRAIYPHVLQTPWLLTGVRFVIGCVVLLLPATCMGATLPVLVRFATRTIGGAPGEQIARLYGTNTLGAAFGTIVAGFALIPLLGLRTTTFATAAVNVAVGVVALFALRARVSEEAPRGLAAAAPSSAAAAPLGPWLRRWVLATFALSGFCAMVYQIAWTRALVMSLGSTTYSFTCILSAFILGLALGSLAVSRRIERWTNLPLVFGIIQCLIGLSAILIAPLYGWIPWLIRPLITITAASYGTLLAGEFALIILVTFVPTFLMGAAFPLVARLCVHDVDDTGAATGRAYAINTLGTIAGAFLAGFVLIRSSVLGAQNLLTFASVLSAAAGATLIVAAGRRRAAEQADGAARAARGGVLRWAALLVPGAVAWLGLLAGRWDPLLFSAGVFLPGANPAAVALESEVIYQADGVDLTVTVLRNRKNPDGLTLTVNGKADASTFGEDMVTQLLIAHLPAMLLGEGDRACIVGLGSGMTLGALSRHEFLQRIDCPEISEEVIEAARLFNPYTYHVLDDPRRAHVIYADGRNHLLLTDRTYDLIVSQPSNPWMAGVSNLFTREYFELCRRRLGPDGVLCAWIHGYMMSLEDFRVVTRTLLDVFPDATLWEALPHDYIFIASMRPQSIPLRFFLERFHSEPVRTDLARAGLGEPEQVLGRFITDGRALREWSTGARVHTDDNALLEFSAPKHVYASEMHRIADALYARRRSVFDGTLDPRGESDAAMLRSRIARMCDAAAVARRADAIWMTEPARSIRLFLEAYEIDPHNYNVFLRLHRARRLMSDPAAAALVPRSLIEAIRRLPPPPLAPLRAGAPRVELSTRDHHGP